MKITVICPTYNSESFVEDTLHSVFSQTRLPEELVLVDDGSSDRTVELLEKLVGKYSSQLRCLIIQGDHKGPGAARNRGIQAATGDWIAFIDSDDLWEKTKLEIIEETLCFYPEINFLCHSEISRTLTGSERKLEYYRRYNQNKPLSGQLFSANLFSTSAVVCKRKVLMDSQGFDESLMSAQDYELWLRLSPNLNVFFLSDILGKYIHRPGNITSSGLNKRLKNELKIAIKYRHYVPKTGFIIRICRILISFTIQFFRRYS